MITKNKGCHLIENNYILQTKTDNVIYIPFILTCTANKSDTSL